jgi:hypothetical protein
MREPTMAEIALLARADLSIVATDLFHRRQCFNPLALFVFLNLTLFVLYRAGVHYGQLYELSARAEVFHHDSPSPVTLAP